MRETKYMKALRNGKTYAEVKSLAGTLRKFVVMGKDKKGKTFVNEAYAYSNREAKQLALTWCKKHDLEFDMVKLVA